VISLGPCSPRHVDTPSGVGFHRQRHGAAKLSGREACGGALFLAGCDGLIRRRYGAATRTRRGSQPCRSRVVCEWVRAHGVLVTSGKSRASAPWQPPRRRARSNRSASGTRLRMFQYPYGQACGSHGEFVRVDEVEWYAARRQRGVFSASAACFHLQRTKKLTCGLL